MHVVYAILNPLARHTVLYVGLASNLKTRYISHLNSTPWIRDFLVKGYLPEGRTLQVIHDLDPAKELARAQEREKYWLEHYLSQDHPLLNTNLLPKEPRQPKQTYIKKLKPVDRQALENEIRRLYTQEHVPRVQILKRLGK